jgi:hypothetical protein
MLYRMDTSELDSKIITAAIAAAGVVISAFVAWIVAIRSSRTELRKQELALYQSYASTLQKERLKAYPIAYKLASNCLKTFTRSELTKEYLNRMLEDFQKWDSENSILLSNQSASVAFNFQSILSTLLVDGSEVIPSKSLHELAEYCEKLELALKTDLGVFAVEYEDKRRVSFYLQ